MEAPEEIVAELRSREPVFHNEPREGGREHLEAMTVPDFFEIGASGRVYSREHVLERVLARHERDEPIVENGIEGFSVLQIGPHAYLATYTLQLPDGHATRTTRRATVWTDRAGRWQVIYHQGTLADPTPT
jgi:hypothetical protein